VAVISPGFTEACVNNVRGAALKPGFKIVGETMDIQTREFFDRHAAKWDGYEKPEIVPIINAVLDRIGVSQEDEILDVGCGTGILAPHFEKRGVKRMSAMDIAPEMVKEYLRKFPGRKVICGDYEEPEVFPPDFFTKIIIFNAFPHFDDREKIFENSYRYLKPGGGLYIVHSMTRADLDRHHREAGAEVADHMLYSNAGFKELYSGAGFKDVEVDDNGPFFSKGSKPG